MRFAVLGGGSWGTALAIHLAHKGHRVKVWEFFAEQAQEMQEKRVCRLLPEVSLPPTIFVSSIMEEVLRETEAVLLAVPSDKVEGTMDQAAHFLAQQPVVICSKGFARGLRLLSTVVEERIQGKVFCLYGPTHAEEVCKGMLSALVLAGEDRQQSDILQKAMEDPYFKIEQSTDLIGVQVCAALKNIVAIFVGLLDGLSRGDNAKAYILTRGLQEIQQVGLAWGADEKTFLGLAGMGDIMVTCSSKHSRNRYVGEQIGKGRKLEQVLAEMNMVAEGVTTLREAITLKEKFSLPLPIITGLYDIVFKQKDPQMVLEELD